MVEQKRIYFKIEDFSRFERTVGEQRFSAPVVIQQLSWNIVVKREVDEETRTRYLGCYVHVQYNAQDNNRLSYWSCIADIILQVLPRQNNIYPVQERFEEKHFDPGRNYHGSARMKTIRQLMFTDNGWYNDDQDNIIVEAIIMANPPYFQYYKLPLPQPAAISPKNSQIKKLANRMKNLLSTGKEADVRFLVGSGSEKKEFSAHKGIITTVSDVFEQMFQFDVNNGNGDRIVEVPDVTPEAFQVLLNYIYAEELDGLSQDNAFDVLYAAKKYNVVSIFDECVDCVKLMIDNVLSILAQACLYELKDLIDSCWTFIDKNASAVLATKEFLQIDQKFLIDLFRRDQLKISDEIEIWNAALYWADEQCKKRDMDCTADNRRTVLGQALYKIRVPLIDKDDFAIFSVSGLLTKNEVISICMYHINPSFCEDLYPLSFSSKHRAY